MSRYIDAEKIEYKHTVVFIEKEDEMSVYKSEIDAMPTADVVEVVRCKDCENWDIHWVSSTFTENAHHCVVLNNVFNGDFYCACGHRRRSL